MLSAKSASNANKPNMGEFHLGPISPTSIKLTDG